MKNERYNGHSTHVDAISSEILNTVPDAVVSIGADQRIVLFNNAAESLFGYSRDEVIGQSLDILIPSAIRHQHKKHVHDFHTAQEPPRYKHSRGGIFGLAKDGRTFPVEASISTIDVDGRVIITAVLRDISERYQTEIMLRKLSAAVEQSSEAVMITRPDGTIEYVNRAFSTITGYSFEEALGCKPSLLKSLAQPSEVYSELWQTITAGEVWEGVLTDQRKDGSFYPARTSISPVLDDDGVITHFVSFQQDMTEKNAMEKRFLQAQKMEALGTFVGGISHDFNNLLSGMLGQAYLCRKMADGDRKLLERLELIESLGRQGSEMIKQLLTFVRKEDVETETVSLSSFIKEINKFIRTAILEDIEFNCTLGEDEMMVKVNPNQFYQVIMNLITNAVHAVSAVEQPEISLDLRLVTVDAIQSGRYEGVKAGQYAQLSVSDNGYGVDENLAPKILVHRGLAGNRV
ncbi:PAS domain S-box protein [Mariprofundus sp. KV]|uniref:PAS domain S-box protein n=1 Tax=Mariprofundus sp. KV TaxID=2608715 RepID=UPI00159FFE6D|nr:PAS domain S-box protein [Mariprofundus sp. KV]